MEFLPVKILAIETSCDETAAAVIEKTKDDIRILSNVVASQIEFHKQFGGVFPEHASRLHCEKIISVVEKALYKASLESSKWVASAQEKVIDAHIKRTSLSRQASQILNSIDLITVTVGPGLIGSLLIGVNFAKTLAYAAKKPIIGINHLLGHIYSNWAQTPQPKFPALILIVSGGHSGLYLMKAHNDIRSLGETLDDAAGEAFDKVAKLLNLSYPGGPAISAEAEKFKILNFKFKINLPRPMITSTNYNFSFSGLKTAVLYELKKHHRLDKRLMAREFQQAVIDVLIAKTVKAAAEFQPKSICLCGGVSANKELRAQMRSTIKKLNPKISFHVPPLELSTDNAAMIGLAAAYQSKSQWRDFSKINANANMKL